MRVSVFGLGYVGVVSATSLARAGHDVVGVDPNVDKVNMLNDGRAPIVEPGLQDALQAARAGGKLRATVSCRDAVDNSDLALICVGTPSRDNGQLDSTAVERVGMQIGACIKGRTDSFLAVLRSTVLPGTTLGVFRPALLAGAGKECESLVKVAMNPEFMREGSALKDFAEPPMTLVGALDSQSALLVQSLYSGTAGEVVCTNIETAEMVKYVCNAYHALKVSFANEIGDLCEALGADPHEVMRIFCLDKKLNISSAYLKPGFAFGGSCLPKDVRALVHAAWSRDMHPPLLGSILPANEAQIRLGCGKVLATKKRRVGVVGLAFKADTDDLREGPMVALVENLIGKGASVKILDSNVAEAHLIGANRQYIDEHLPHFVSLLCTNVEELIEHAEVIVVGNANKEAAAVLKAVKPQQLVIDLTRGALRLSAAAMQ